MEISVSKGFLRVDPRGVPASAPEIPSPRGRKLGTARGRCTDRGGGLRGPSAAPRSGAGARGGEKEVRTAVPGPQCGRLAPRTRVESGLSWRQPGARGKPWEARGTQGPEE